MLKPAPIAAAVFMALTTIPANSASPSGTPGVSDGTVSSGPNCSDNNPACAGESSRTKRRRPPEETGNWPPEQNIPPGYYRDDKPRVIRPPRRDEPRYRKPIPPDSGYVRLSCDQAKEVLADHGFYRIRTRDCVGRYYSFRADWHGHRYIVSIRARDGKIVSVTPA